MSTINFPSNPWIDELYTFNSKTWKFNGSGWALVPATPGGIDGQVQYNNNGLFGGITNVTSDGTNLTALTVAGAKANFAQSVAGYASINMPHGVAPTSPVDGDMWTTAAGVYVRISGVTIGPLSTGSGTGGQLLVDDTSGGSILFDDSGDVLYEG